MVMIVGDGLRLCNRGVCLPGGFGGAVDITERHAGGCSDFGAGFEFGGKGLSTGRIPGVFAVDGSPGSLDMDDLAAADSAFDCESTDAKGSGFVEEDLFAAGGVGGATECTQENSRPILLHLDGGCEDIEGVCSGELLADVANDFGSDIVEVGFEQDNEICVRSGGC